MKAGAKVKAIVQQNFRLGGFQNGALEKWPETRRQSSGSGADSCCGPLLTSRKVLYGGTGYIPGDACVTIYSWNREAKDTKTKAVTSVTLSYLCVNPGEPGARLMSTWFKG